MIAILVKITLICVGLLGGFISVAWILYLFYLELSTGVSHVQTILPLAVVLVLSMVAIAAGLSS